MATKLEQSLLIRAFKKEAIPRFPVWMMRQAGRYQASYRALREKHTLLEMVKTPELAAQVTIAAIDEFDFDAAIIFSDILIVLESMGLDLEFVKGEGPKLSAIEGEADIAKLRVPDPVEAFSYTLDAIKMATASLDTRGVPLIGFAGAPFTLACYALEGGGSRDYLAAKRLAFSRPDLFQLLCDKIADTCAAFLLEQAKAGASALQIFDSWAGVLSPTDYERFALPFAKKVVELVRPAGIPIVYFSTGTSSYLPLLAQTRADGIGLDWRANLQAAFHEIGNHHAIQGNLDSAYLFAPWQELKSQASRLLDNARACAPNGTGFVFNLGHGIMQHTPERNVKLLVELVKHKV